MIDQYRSMMATLSNEHPLLGIALVHHRNMRGQPMSFADKPYLLQPYMDGPKLDEWVVRKAVQTGWSEWCIQFALERAGWHGRIVAYVLPTYPVRDRFVQQRIDPLLLDVPAYRERAPGSGFQSSAQLAKKAAGNLKLKRFGPGSLLFLGSNTEGDFVEFSADILIIDEFDACESLNLAKARDRVRASPYAQIVRLGNPTLPRVGISRMYDDSDMRRWFYRCDRCGFRQPLDWFLNVVQQDGDGAWVPRDKARWSGLNGRGSFTPTPYEDIRPVCLRCHEPFVRKADGALWVPEQPSRKMRGYTVSLMDVLTNALWPLFCEWLAAQADPEALQTFYKSVLGVPFEFQGARLTGADLEATCTGDPIDWTGGDKYRGKTVVAGVDVGSVLHTTIDVITPGKDDEDPVRTCVFVGAARTFEEVADLFQRYHVDVAVVDSQPEIHKAQELRDQFLNEGGAVVWLCRFHPTPRAGTQKYGMRLDYQGQIVVVDRTSVFDVAFADIKGGRRAFPEDAFSVLGWGEQMKAPVRVLDETRARVVWEEGNAPDHYRLSDVYARVAADLLAAGGTYSAG